MFAHIKAGHLHQFTFEKMREDASLSKKRPQQGTAVRRTNSGRNIVPPTDQSPNTVSSFKPINEIHLLERLKFLRDSGTNI